MLSSLAGLVCGELPALGAPLADCCALGRLQTRRVSGAAASGARSYTCPERPLEGEVCEFCLRCILDGLRFGRPLISYMASRFWAGACLDSASLRRASALIASLSRISSTTDTAFVSKFHEGRSGLELWWRFRRFDFAPGCARRSRAGTADGAGFAPILRGTAKGDCPRGIPMGERRDGDVCAKSRRGDTSAELTGPSLALVLRCDREPTRPSPTWRRVRERRRRRCGECC